MTQKTAIITAAALLAAAAGGSIYIASDAKAPSSAKGRSRMEPKTTSIEVEAVRSRDRRADKEPTSGKSWIKPRLDEAGWKHLQEGPDRVLSAHAAVDGGAWSLADDNLLVAWAAQDPVAAMQWIRSGERAVSYGNLLGAVAAGTLIADGKEAMLRFLTDHQNDSKLPPKDQGELETRLFYHLGRTDTIDVAMEMLSDTENGALAGALIGGIEGTQNKISAIDGLEAKGIPVSPDYWSLQNDIGKDPRFWTDWAWQRKSELLNDTLSAWHRQNPEETKRWIDERIPKNDPRRADIDELIHVREEDLTDP